MYPIPAGVNYAGAGDNLALVVSWEGLFASPVLWGSSNEACDFY